MTKNFKNTLFNHYVFKSQFHNFIFNYLTPKIPRNFFFLQIKKIRSFGNGIITTHSVAEN